MDQNGRMNQTAGGAGPAADGPAPGGMYRYVQGAGFVPADRAEAWGQGAQGLQGQAGQQAQGQAAQQGQGQNRPEGAERKYEENRFGDAYGMLSDVMNGQADPGKILGFLQSPGGDFWKGALVGAAAVFLINNDAVKGALAGAFGGLFGAGGETPATAGKE